MLIDWVMKKAWSTGATRARSKHSIKVLLCIALLLRTHLDPAEAGYLRFDQTEEHNLIFLSNERLLITPLCLKVLQKPKSLQVQAESDYQEEKLQVENTFSRMRFIFLSDSLEENVEKTHSGLF